MAAGWGVLYLTAAAKASVGACYTADAFVCVAAVIAAESCCRGDAAKAAVMRCYAALVRYSTKLGRKSGLLHGIGKLNAGRGT